MRKYLPYILAFGVPFVLYSPTLLGTFYYDDNVIFLGHQAKVMGDNPFKAFSGSMHYLPGAPRSVHVFALLVIYKLFGPVPFPYHLFNLTLHALSTVLVYHLLKRFVKVAAGTGELGGSIMSADPRVADPRVADPRVVDPWAAAEAAPLLGALLFGLHPVHVENITFVTLGGTDIFYTFWALTSLNLYVMFRDKTLGGAKNYALLALSAAAFYLCLISKESAVAFVLIFPLTELMLGGRAIYWAAPHAVVLLAGSWDVLFSAAPQAVGQVVSGTGTGPGAGPGKAGLAEVLMSLGFFLKSLIVPWPHKPFIKEFGQPALLYALAGLTAIWALAGVVRKDRLLWYSALWFTVVSAPYLLVPTSPGNVAITAERYIYAPSVAFAVLGAWGVTAALRSERARRAILPAAMVVLAVYGALGIGYFYGAWRTEEAFWRHAIKSNPGYVSGYVSLASIKAEGGDLKSAEAILREGLGKPKGMPAEFAQAANGLGRIFLGRGDKTRAESYFLLSIRYSPYEFSFIELGYLYLGTRRFENAIWAFDNALRFRDAPRTQLGLAFAYEQTGQREQALHYATLAARAPRNPALRQAAEGVLSRMK